MAGENRCQSSNCTTTKKWANHEAMLALWFGFYNYCRKHMTLKETPAMASGLADHIWTIRELIEESAKH